jgi:hypothetical protein
MQTDQPKRPLHTWTTGQLTDYQHELGEALSHLPEFAEVCDLLRGRISEVLAELESRAAVSSTSILLA